MVPSKSHIFLNNMGPHTDNRMGLSRPSNGENLTVAPVTSHTSSIEMGPLFDNDTDHFQSYGSENLDWMGGSELIDGSSIQKPTPSSEFLQIQPKVEPQATQHGAQDQGQLMSFTDSDRACTADTKASVEDNQAQNDNNSAEVSVRKFDQAQWQELNEIQKALGGIHLDSNSHYQSLAKQLQDNRSYCEAQFGDLKKQMEESLNQGKSPAAVTVESELAQEKERRRKLESDYQKQAHEIIKLKLDNRRLSGMCQELHDKVSKLLVQQPQLQQTQKRRVHQLQARQLQAPQLQAPQLQPQQHQAQQFHMQAQQLQAPQFQAHQPQVLQPPMESTQQFYECLMKFWPSAPCPPELNGIGNSFEQHPGLKEHQQGPTSVPIPTDFQFDFSTNGVFEGSESMGRPEKPKRRRQDVNAAQQEGKQERRIRKSASNGGILSYPEE
ncbi:hypothetical protein QR685DRAFT_476726 [Neurospora intermedia]|uniref:BZIP domain-containing protein n=1 Tax=Neurospora intermedia TaxID=5142 RepID=A0ABR3DB68_NEUIN